MAANTWFNFVRNLGGSPARGSSNPSGQPNWPLPTQENAAPRGTLDRDDASIETDPPPYYPALAISRDFSTSYEGSDQPLASEPLQSFHEHNNLHPATARQHRDTSTQTSSPPPNEENAGFQEAAIRSSSHSGTLCTCISRPGCCREHNSIRTPNRAPMEHLNDFRDLSIWMPVGSTFTLEPIHYTMGYHLSFDNLDCIRRRLGSEAERAFIPELSLAGSTTSDKDTQYVWSSEIYFDKGTFLQKQEIHTAYYKHNIGSQHPPENLTGCSHHFLSIHTPEFSDRNGMCEAEAVVMGNPARCTSHVMHKWNSSQGPYTHITSCTICHADTECYIDMNGSYLDVRYTCFKDLGAGIDPRDPKWLSVLTGVGITRRPKYEFEIFSRVWYVAQDLKRNNLYEVTHHTPNGVFHVRSRGGE